MSSYRRVSAVAVAALLISGVTAPAALAATPEKAPAATTVAPTPDTPLIGAGLSLDLNAAVDLEAHGIVAVGIGGASDDNGTVSLTVGKGSRITHKNHKIVSGKVLLQGGIQLSKGAKKVVVSNVAVDVKTGLITAKIGAKANVRIGTVNNPAEAKVELLEGSTNATLKLGEQGIHLNAGLFADLDAQLGTCLTSDIDASAGVDVDAVLDVDANLAVGAKLNTDLIVALGLDADIDLNLGVQGLLDAVVAVDISLF
ncbi:hypothetical protein [Streptomyces sp. NPDC059009]|uniref:hypothetical protein n=1 Tax=Streptomyces sp. NPDC059009 TaxID=3346694 RepID=UPI00367FE419